MPELNKIKNIVVVMMENRSFDHALGYLSLNQFGRPEIDGLKDDPNWNAKVASVYNGAAFPRGIATIRFIRSPAIRRTNGRRLPCNWETRSMASIP